jgi:hypothetical protein
MIDAVSMWNGLEKYHERMETYKKWKKAKRLDPAALKVGDTVDVLDRENVWCSGLVELKIMHQDRPALLYIHYEGWHRKFDEYMFINSKRLAPTGYYTSRPEIPRYLSQIAAQAYYSQRSIFRNRRPVLDGSDMTRSYIARNREE